MGKIYPAAKVIVNNEVILDVTNTTATPTEIAKGFKIVSATGAEIEGTLKTQILTCKIYTKNIEDELPTGYEPDWFSSIEEAKEHILSAEDIILHDGDFLISLEYFSHIVENGVVTLTGNPARETYVYLFDENLSSGQWITIGSSTLCDNYTIELIDGKVSLYGANDIAISEEQEFIPCLTTENGNKSLKWILNEDKIGKSGTGENAEIFNDYDKNFAAGAYSHAEGGNTAANGNYSHSEGYQSVAFGNDSHAEGTSSYNAIDAELDDYSKENVLECWDETGKFSLALGEASHIEGKDCLALGEYSHAEGEYTIAADYGSHAEGTSSRATGRASHAEGGSTMASGQNSHAEGSGTMASGPNSHAEGIGTMADGQNSHAEGGGSNASGVCSHAEGDSTTASGYSAHSEGDSTIASGEYAHTEGSHTKASSQYQHVQGKWNIEDSADIYAHIIGNGTPDIPSNAHTVDWHGNAWYSGRIKCGGTDYNSSNAIPVALQTDIEEALLNAGIQYKVKGISRGAYPIVTEEGKYYWIRQISTDQDLCGLYFPESVSNSNNIADLTFSEMEFVCANGAGFLGYRYRVNNSSNWTYVANSIPSGSAIYLGPGAIINVVPVVLI